jgi:Ni/Co efflux regulator RcnB
MRGIPKEVGKKSAEDDDTGPGKGKGKGKGQGQGQGQGKSDELPPGLAKKEQLPPGLAKRDKLPPGLQRDKLPTDLVAKLPAPPRGTERILIGDDLVLIDQKTQVVLDILKNATKLAQ